MAKKRTQVGSKPRSRKSRKVIANPLASEKEFTNREIGWLHFNRRVLHEAEDSRTPLLERVKFLSIFDSNLNEFFMKRVGGLKRQIAFGIDQPAADGQTPAQQLVSIRKMVVPLIKEQSQIYRNIHKLLGEKKIFLVKYTDLSTQEKVEVKKYFMKNVFPVLTPLSVDPGHPFPFISNLSTSLGVTIRHNDQDEKHFARVKIPKVLPQWVKVEAENSSAHRYVHLLDVIKENIGELFPQMEVLAIMPFRITRNADIEREEEGAEDLLEMIEEELRQRRIAEVVRLEHGPKPDPWMLKFLVDELELQEDDLYEVAEELDYTDLNMIADLPIKELKFEPWNVAVPPAFVGDESMFSVIRKGDQLVHHPYESFQASVEKFIRVAADDPKVLAIKMTLYRTGDNSPFIKNLIRAAEEGKQVVCLIELKARFDEERNIYWAQALENAGVHVVYGVVGLKTHSKLALVVRQESEALRCYAHVGTGNYNAGTAKLYTDLGLFTCNEAITSEILELFNYLTGRSLKKDYQALLVAPLNMVSRFLQMIDREKEHAALGRPAQIIAKFNNMEENNLSMHLYRAAQAGVGIDMIVRGFCCARPGVPGLSENLRVMSVIGRFLEHSRIFYFRNGAENPLDGEFFIGSADWMYRNLHARVETIVPIFDRVSKEKLWEILQIMLKDQRQAWDMQADGTYKQRNAEGALGTHEQLMQLTKSRTVTVDDSSNEGQS
ncbi:MAG: polyphosphate kinase 1 [Pseudobdellovibrionaceae bacterium]